MNRAARRAQPRLRRHVAQLVAAWRCPSCTTTPGLAPDPATGYLRPAVVHDDTCPWLAAHRSRQENHR